MSGEWVSAAQSVHEGFIERPLSPGYAAATPWLTAVNRITCSAIWPTLLFPVLVLLQLENQHLRISALVKNHAVFACQHGTVTNLQRNAVQCYLATRDLHVDISV